MVTSPMQLPQLALRNTQCLATLTEAKGHVRTDHKQGFRASDQDSFACFPLGAVGRYISSVEHKNQTGKLHCLGDQMLQASGLPSCQQCSLQRAPNTQLARTRLQTYLMQPSLLEICAWFEKFEPISNSEAARTVQ